MSPQSLVHTNLLQDSPSAPPLSQHWGFMSKVVLQCFALTMFSSPVYGQALLNSVWSCINSLKKKKKKSGESQADTDGCERNFKMPFNIAVPPSGIEEFAPCFFSFPGVLWGVIQSRPVPLTQLTLLQPDRLSSPQGDGNSSRGDCPTWGAAPAALCTIPCT